LMRAGYSGSQRFGMIPWSGDVNRTWGGLKSQPEIALQMGMQGMGYMHSDLGGFAGPNLDDELYARWLQYGVFQPIFRPHAQEEVAAEPVLREQKTKALAKAAIELRYRLLPYNYTLAYENNQQGLPLMRPLFYEEPHNEKLFSVSDSYLWGHEFLVSPVLSSSVKEASIYFPNKNNWFDFYTEQKYQAGSTQTVVVVSDHIPVFVRAGAFVPMIKVIQTTKNYSTKELDLHYYHDAAITKSSGKLYDDNGDLPKAVEKGAFTVLNFDSVFDKNSLSIVMSAKNGKQYQAIDRNISLIIHNVSSQPEQVLSKNGALGFAWDEKKRLLSVSVPWSKKSNEKVNIKFSNRISS
jgi:oligosaccharide 4-alpha-D-glucosyltransferase